jgi:hypothetical protein
MDIKTTFEHYLTWFKAHERLVLFLVAGFFAIHFYGKGLDYLIKHDKAQTEIATQQAVVAATKVNQDDVTNKLLLVQLQTLQQQVAATNIRLDQSMRDRATATTTQKQKNDQSAPAELAARIQAVLGVGTIKVDTTDANVDAQLIFSNDAAHTNADRLEDLLQAQGDIKDLNTRMDGCKAVTNKQEDTITGLNTQIADGKVALVKEQGSHAEDVKTLKAEKKKAWLNGFKWGAITGFLGSLFVHKP